MINHANRWCGRLPVQWTRIVPMTASHAGDSCDCPALMTTWSRTQALSVARVVCRSHPVNVQGHGRRGHRHRIPWLPHACYGPTGANGCPVAMHMLLEPVMHFGDKRWYAFSMTRTPYPSDVSDEEWAFVASTGSAHRAPSLTFMTEDAPQRDYALREVLNGLRWIVRASAGSARRTGAPWRMTPNDPPPWYTVSQQTQRWLKAGVVATLRQAQAPRSSMIGARCCAKSRGGYLRRVRRSLTHAPCHRPSLPPRRGGKGLTGVGFC